MASERKSDDGHKHKLLKLHEFVVFAAILLIGILIGSFVTGQTITACNDGIDNDGDNRIDLKDPGCHTKNDASEQNQKIECDDGIDNDGDTKRDWPSDTGCHGLLDRNERGTIVCDNGKDDDFDGRIDYPNDPGCSSIFDNSESDEANNTCYDSYNGIDLSVVGYVSGVKNWIPYRYTDYCYDPNFVIKYSCTVSGSSSFWSTKMFNCPFGCLNGGCKNLSAQCNDGKDNDGDSKIDYPLDLDCSGPGDNSEYGSCKDTDFGGDILHKGTISGMQDGQPFIYTDYCTNGNSNIVEYVCTGAYGDRPLWYTDSCPIFNSTNGTSAIGCFDGACA